MKTWVKFLLGAIAVVLAASIGLGVLAVRWFNGTVKATGTLIPAAQKDGRDFGGKSTQDGCVDEATRRVVGCASLACEVAEKGFLDACWGAATVDAKACDGVPKADKILDSATWGIAECKRRGHPSNSRCQRLLSDVQQLCVR
jgi:hypothetical protein